MIAPQVTAGGVVELVAYLSDPPDGGNRYWGGEYSRARAAEAAALISSLEAERDSWRRVAERCKSEAEGHSMEARTANSTIHEIYQVLSGGKGEPGNWNGAEPARRHAEAAESREKVMREAAKPFADNPDGWTVDTVNALRTALGDPDAG